MKSRSSLILMEQVVMILVFALAGALCLYAFLWAQTTSQSAIQRDVALLRAQNAAQILKACGGDFEQAAEQYGGRVADGVWTVCYDADDEQAQRLEAQALSTLPERLGAARVQVTDRVGQPLITLDVRWQEVDAHE